MKSSSHFSLGSDYMISLKTVMKGSLFPFPERLIEAGGTAANSMKQAKEMKGVYYCSTHKIPTWSRISVHEALHKHKPTQ